MAVSSGVLPTADRPAMNWNVESVMENPTQVGSVPVNLIPHHRGPIGSAALTVAVDSPEPVVAVPAFVTAMGTPFGSPLASFQMAALKELPAPPDETRTLIDASLIGMALMN